MENLELVIIGHVDHGKSTLIGRLLLDTDSLPKDKITELRKISKELGSDTALAFVTDQLKEEREQNKTIDTTQIFFKTRKRNYVIIDTPGHVEFIKNMLTGACFAHAAILIIDAHEGIMEQTKRHAYLIKMLGINQLVVALNKIDIIDYSEDKFNKLRDELLGFFKELGTNPSFIIPISAKEAVNITKIDPKTGWYSGPSLLAAIDSFKLNADISERPLRFPIQDIYKMGTEKVLVGRLESGKLKKGQRVVYLPSGEKTTINSIKVFGEPDRKTALAGESIGLVLDSDSPVKRGAVIVEEENLPKLTSHFGGNVFWMFEEPLQLNTPFTFRCATQEVSCIAERIENRINSSTLEVIEESAKELKLNEAAAVTFKTERPIVVENFSFIEELGRFTIECETHLKGLGII